MLPKYAVEGGNALKAGLIGNLRNRHVKVGQKQLGAFDSLQGQVLNKVIVGDFFEDAREIAGAEADVVSG